MKPQIPTSVALGAFLLGVLAACTGCSHVPLGHATLESSFAPAADGEHEFTPPTPLHTVTPTFPIEMRRAGISGSVRITCLVDATGRVRDPLVAYSSHYAFIEPAMVAVQRWRFTPGEREGVPIGTRVSLPVAFAFLD